MESTWRQLALGLCFDAWMWHEEKILLQSKDEKPLLNSTWTFRISMECKVFASPAMPTVAPNGHLTGRAYLAYPWTGVKKQQSSPSRNIPAEVSLP